jgi:hypothetical protein
MSRHDALCREHFNVPVVYAPVFNAYACPVCDRWLETACANEHCLYCRGRPVRPSEAPPEVFEGPAGVVMIGHGRERPLGYILRGREPVAVYAWDRYAPRDPKACTVGRDIVQTDRGPFLVSTVFLGVDHNMLGAGPPLLFESMAFEGEEVTGDDVFMDRYATWDEAEAGHKAMVELVKETYGEGRP